MGGRGVADCGCAADGQRRSVEQRQQSVTRGRHLPAVKALQFGARHVEVPGKRVAPGGIAHRRNGLGRAHQVR
jgi:hypothetical protein